MSFELIAQKLVYGGEALGHHEGRPVFVPGVLPGELAEVEAVRTAKGVVHARAVRIINPSPDRVAPPCPYFGRCGGCHYQHFSAERQSEAKVEILRETLRRIGKIAWDGPIPVHAAHPWNYRNQAQLKVGRLPDGRIELGFFEAESHRLLGVDQCLILSPRLNAMLAELRGPRWSAQLTDCSEIELFADDRDENVAIVLKGRMASQDAASLAGEWLAQLPGVVSVTVEAGGSQFVSGAQKLEYTVGDFRYQISPGSFFQASRFLLPELVNGVTNAEPGAIALDLFAGVGLFTLPLARRFERVIAVEAEPNAAADLARNAEAHSLANIRPIHSTTHDFLRRFAQMDADLAVLDPPRAGVGAGPLRLLVNLRPQRIHYVSCSPPTLARDLGFLVAHGYELNSVELFDLFPQTYHVESLARLVRRGL